MVKLASQSAKAEAALVKTQQKAAADTTQAGGDDTRAYRRCLAAAYQHRCKNLFVRG